MASSSHGASFANPYKGVFRIQEETFAKIVNGFQHFCKKNSILNVWLKLCLCSLPEKVCKNATYKQSLRNSA